MTSSTPVPAGPPPDRESLDNHGEAGWFWVDLPGLRQAFLDAGFTELKPLVADRPVVLMERSVAGDTQETLVPLRRYPGWGQVARTALSALEVFTGASTARLAAVTQREAELWRVIQDTRDHLAAYASCGGTHVVDAAGNISHHDPSGRVDLFEHGRCEMRTRIAERLEHVLGGGE